MHTWGDTEHRNTTLDWTSSLSTAFIRKLGIFFLGHLDHKKLGGHFQLIKTFNTIREVRSPYIITGQIKASVSLHISLSLYSSGAKWYFLLG